jgi:hypothetical protein
MRFLTGLTVSVSSLTEKRAKALFNACKKAGAKTVGAVHVQADKNIWDQSGWCEVYHG